MQKTYAQNPSSITGSKLALSLSSESLQREKETNVKKLLIRAMLPLTLCAVLAFGSLALIPGSPLQAITPPLCIKGYNKCITTKGTVIARCPHHGQQLNIDGKCQCPVSQHLVNGKCQPKRPTTVVLH